MLISELLSPWLSSENLPALEIQAIHNDSRNVIPGALFVAYPGQQQDGRRFIESAIAQGAVAILYDPAGEYHYEGTVPGFALPELGQHLAAIAARFYPALSLFQSIGITGTNGKTTIAYLLAQAYTLVNIPCLYIGTLGHGLNSSFTPLLNTTPDALHLGRLMQSYYDQGCRRLAMEVSSHALDQHRVETIPFQQAIFTNLTRDHLDYHGTMEAYARAKAQLFAFPSVRVAIVNVDDPAAAQMLAAVAPGVRILRYGLHAADAEFKIVESSVSIKGTRGILQTPAGSIPLEIDLLGDFNLYNVLAVAASLFAEGYSNTRIVEVLRHLQAPPGRLEVIAQSPGGVVDYAHTPDALENVLSTLKPLTQGRLWVIFGCGGDRDPGKRVLMGKIASQYADEIMVTSDNPRSEDPQLIIDAIVQGIPSGVSYACEVDRKKAIMQVFRKANPKDVILVAGKGHESYQEVLGVRRPFSDQQVIRELLRA
ncbi:MAG: UDP-N-acetylmuramoyl-L-alanyl-D-glutamate--2,6-diaminopimelate ligase [Legionellaceae bacterium]|nr:UDP-N-acetylmuramoyl-L-alanyl-D-glutamate--2,6-diaminopimelate ligase [Legionellaceae bacterium]